VSNQRHQEAERVVERASERNRGGKSVRRPGAAQGKGVALAAKNDLVAWEMFRNCVTDTMGVVAAEDPAIYDHWFRFLEEVGKEKVRSLALAFEFEDRATWRPVWNLMFKWCAREVREQLIKERTAERRTVYELRGLSSRSWPASDLTHGWPDP
jgi:hypothetical protein